MDLDKTTALDNNADIYKQREEKSNMEVFKEMSFSEKIIHFREYYRNITIISLIIITFIVYLIVTMMKPRIDTKLNMTIIDSPIFQENLDNFKITLEDYFEIDPKTENIDINNSMYFNSGAEFELNARQAITVYFMAGDIDIIIAQENDMNNFATQGMLIPLSSSLPIDLNDSLSNSFYSATDEETGQEDVYGILLKDSPLFKDYISDETPYILGIAANSSNLDNAIACIRLIFN